MTIRLELIPESTRLVIAGRDEDFTTFDEAALNTRCMGVDTEIRIVQNEVSRLNHQLASMRTFVKDNLEKIRMNNQLPYLIATVLETHETESIDDDTNPISIAGVDFDVSSLGMDRLPRKSYTVIIKTSTRNVVCLKKPGFVDAKDLKVGDIVGVNKDTFLIMQALPRGFDTRVQAMEIIDKPTESYNDIGGLDTQIQELLEAVVLPLKKKDLFERLGIRAPRGVLLYGPPGTGKTLLVRACAAESDATIIKLSASQFVQMFIGDGAKLVRDVFDMAREKQPSIIFIDELDAIGTKRSGSNKHGDREVQRTMLELLTQLDGFNTEDDVKVICATNRAEDLDPALLRSGRLDRKIEFPHPDQTARQRILRIHSEKMNVASGEVNYNELARSTSDMNGAQLKAVCVEAGMSALRRKAKRIVHNDFTNGLNAVLARKLPKHDYFA